MLQRRLDAQSPKQHYERQRATLLSRHAGDHTCTDPAGLSITRVLLCAPACRLDGAERPSPERFPAQLAFPAALLRPARREPAVANNATHDQGASNVTRTGTSRQDVILKLRAARDRA